MRHGPLDWRILVVRRDTPNETLPDKYYRWVDCAEVCKRMNAQTWHSDVLVLVPYQPYAWLDKTGVGAVERAVAMMEAA